MSLIAAAPLVEAVLKGDRFRAYQILNRLVWRYKRDEIPYTGLSMTHGNAQSVTVFPSSTVPMRWMRPV